ncbi:hypothetical protein NUW58_g10607 [Xylaria curta]|uniref:Uncharacterized protein n=1 Tax=Xylaria curta TaxID=42375 RepID=A0ACC1MI38_9PEZI|nr:hypothetical protein NUW58_g10607 [Xylaria curta]
MARDTEKSTKLKEEGNDYFKIGNFVAAEGLYSKAIIADDANPSLYTNRAMSRIKLNLFESASTDCDTCLKLSGPNMKAYYILSQCLLALHDPDGALENALRAHRLGTDMGDKSLTPLTEQVLRCKKARWEELEKSRAREGQALENELMSLLERDHIDNYTACDSDVERKELEEETEKKKNLLRSTFEAARAASAKKREVPDWAIDDIKFGIMVDPVIVYKNGQII